MLPFILLLYFFTGHVNGQVENTTLASSPCCACCSPSFPIPADCVPMPQNNNCPSSNPITVCKRECLTSAQCPETTSILPPPSPTSETTQTPPLMTISSVPETPNGQPPTEASSTGPVATQTPSVNKCCACCNEQYPDIQNCLALESYEMCQMNHYTKVVCVNNECQLTDHCLIQGLVNGICYETTPQFDTTTTPPPTPTQETTIFVPSSQPTTSSTVTPFIPSTICCGCCNEQYPHANNLCATTLDASGTCQELQDTYPLFTKLVCVAQQCQLRQGCPLEAGFFGSCYPSNFPNFTPFIPPTICCGCCNEQYPHVDNKLCVNLDASGTCQEWHDTYPLFTKLVCVAQQCRLRQDCPLEAGFVGGCYQENCLTLGEDGRRKCTVK